ncbi:hypothetical protein M569_01485, partial [Genlisea aurea]
MGGQGWSLTAKLCDSCKAAPATVFCRADSAFICVPCDGRIHAANKLASRHARVWVCEVCEQAPASVTCKADAAALCASCDRDIHSANPLARRHDRHPVVAFYDAASAVKSSAAENFSEEEAEAASWLLPDPNAKAEEDEDSGSPEYKSAEYLFTDMDPYLDLDLIAGEEKTEKKEYSTDGVVPGPIVDGYPSYDVEYAATPKPFMYSFASSQSMSHSVSLSSSCSMEVGVVPEQGSIPMATAVSGSDREARVLRYKEKRKNRKFEKTIRYASRKAYAETRPRIKGRFAKRSELEVDS